MCVVIFGICDRSGAMYLYWVNETCVKQKYVLDNVIFVNLTDHFVLRELDLEYCSQINIDGPLFVKQRQKVSVEKKAVIFFFFFYNKFSAITYGPSDMVMFYPHRTKQFINSTLRPVERALRQSFLIHPLTPTLETVWRWKYTVGFQQKITAHFKIVNCTGTVDALEGFSIAPTTFPLLRLHVYIGLGGHGRGFGPQSMVGRLTVVRSCLKLLTINR